MKYSRISGKAAVVAVAALASASAAFIPGCGRETAVLLSDPVEKISRSESNCEALQSMVVADEKADVLIHIDTADDIRVFPSSYRESIRNAADHLKRKNIMVVDQLASFIELGGTVNLGHKAGLYKRVIWVLPATVSVGSQHIKQFRKVMRAKRNYTEMDLSDLKIDGKYIKGTLADIPLTVTNLEDLEVPAGETAILDIDLKYFLGLKAQEEQNRMGTRVVIDFLRSLKRKNISVKQVSINLSTFDGMVPMDMRYFGSVLTEIISDPGILESELPDKYRMMLEAEDALMAGDYARSEALYTQLTGSYASDPGLFFSLGVSRGFAGKGEAAAEALLQAYDLDTSYLRGIFQFARVLAVNRMIEAGEKILKDPNLANLIPEEELDFQKGLFFFNAELFHDALIYLELVEDKRPNDFALKTVMYQAYKQTDNLPKMTGTLERLIRLDESRVIRDMPWVFKELGELSEEVGVFQRAREMYEKYLDYVPGDEDAEKLRAKIEEWKAKGI